MATHVVGTDVRVVCRLSACRGAKVLLTSARAYPLGLWPGHSNQTLVVCDRDEATEFLAVKSRKRVALAACVLFAKQWHGLVVNAPTANQARLAFWTATLRSPSLSRCSGRKDKQGSRLVMLPRNAATPFRIQQYLLKTMSGLASCLHGCEAVFTSSCLPKIGCGT